MTRLLELIRSLGNRGAVDNAGALAASRRREDWVIAALQRSAAHPTAAGASVRRSA